MIFQNGVPQSGLYQQYLPQYQIPQQQPQIPQQHTDAIYVNGVGEAAAWVVQRGQTVRLWDSNEPKFYIKSVGDNGMPNPIEIYRYERETAPVPQENEKVEYITRDEFEKRLSELQKPQRGKKKEAEDESDV